MSVVLSKFMNMVMSDGSRHFGDLPQTVLWYDLRDHIARMPGVGITGFVTDDVIEAWIDFTYEGHRFSVNDQHGSYWFFVEDPACPDELLEKVLAHCERLLVPNAGAATGATEEGKPGRMLPYEVVIGDNFHYMEEEENYRLGRFDSCETAIVASKSVIDEFLVSTYKAGMTATTLFEYFTTFGDSPFILGGAVRCEFSAWDYARQRCEELCGA